jgi:cysteine-rich repeat protein
VFPGDFDLVALRFEGTPAACGNGVVEPGEACDDGGTIAGDGCDAACQIETGFACGLAPSVCTPGCGNGTVAGLETCDDGNLVAGDGCDGACLIEQGWSCTGSPSVCLAVCGDSRIVGAEQCDDGNGSSGDCCSTSCQSEPTGGPCTADTSQCSFDLCSAHGYCTHEFVPDPSCGQPALPGRATLRILDLPGATHDRAELKITKGPAVAKPAFGIPALAAPTYTLCVYGELAGVPSILLDATAAGDGDCSDGTCWQEKPWGWKQKSSTGSPDGVVSMKLREGIAGKSKLIMQAKGQHLATPSLPLSTDGAVTAQIRTSDGQCFGGVFPVPATNTSSLYRAKSQ